MDVPSTSKHKSNEGSPRLTMASDLIDTSSDGIKVKRLIENRAKEIAMTIEDVKKKLPKGASQQLPKHMRRRSVSHNVKRLPKRIQGKVQKEANATKRPSRKYRRRASNLMAEFGRRQGPGKDTWLETHVWHAKRFKMTNRWGYKLPLTPNDKGGRAMHRATKQHCLISDCSYYGCIELLGPQEKLLEKLGKLCSPETGLTFAAKSYLPGTREGRTTLYCVDQYPYDAIGPVSFFWKPVCPDESTGVRQLWIWTHPACHALVVSQLGLVLELDVENLISDLKKSCSEPTTNESKLKSDQTVPVSSLTASSGDHETEKSAVSPQKKCLAKVKTETGVESIASALKPIFKPDALSSCSEANNSEVVESKVNNNVAASAGKTSLKRKVSFVTDDKTCKKVKVDDSVVNTPCKDYTPSVSNKIFTLRILKDTLIRFTLQGPRSHAVLHETLRAVDLDGEEADAASWWQQYYVEENRRRALRLQTELWKGQRSTQSPACLSPGCVIALSVRDPRMVALPKTKTNPEQPLESFPRVLEQFTPIPPEVSLGPIWNQDMRNAATSSQIPQQKLNALKAAQGPFETELKLGSKENKVPLMLIQKPGMDQSGYGSGWDVIIPRGWAMPFWIAFIYRGARVSGLQDLHRTCLENKQPLFPDHYPDTNCGREHQETTRKELTTKHFRYPPNKRPNFQKLGVMSPFNPPWRELVQEWNETTCGRFYVLRNRKILLGLDLVLKTGIVSQILKDQKYGDALVCVSVSCLFKGVPSEFASLCMLEDEDFFQLRFIRKPSGPSEAPKRKGIVKEKLKTKKAQEYIENRPQVEGLLTQCQRKPIGYLEEGRFSLFNGQAVGLGFCAFKALLKLGEMCHISKSKPSVLVRGQNSFQYRFAEIKLIV